MSPGDIVKEVRNLKGVSLTSTSMRDAGQSDYKNRLRSYDLKTLAPHYIRWASSVPSVTEEPGGMWG